MIKFSKTCFAVLVAFALVESSGVAHAQVTSRSVNVMGYVDNADRTDDSRAIIRAFEAARVTGKPLYFAAGTYNVTREISFLLNDAIQTKGIQIIGDGKGLSIIDANWGAYEAAGVHRHDHRRL